MAIKLADRVKETTTSTGTGTVNLGGASTGFQTFVTGLGLSTGATQEVYYGIVLGSEWETGLGTVTEASTDTLSRDTVLESSNSGSAVSFSTGTKEVFLTVPAKKVYAAPILHVRDEKSTGTNGGNSAAATWNIRTLNTVATNDISGASLASNQITLPAGTYYVRAHAPAFRCTDHRLRLWNDTDSTATLLGPGIYLDTGTDGDGGMAHLMGYFTSTAEKNFELHHYTTSAVTNGLGRAVGDGATEVYAEVWVEQRSV